MTSRLLTAHEAAQALLACVCVALDQAATEVEDHPGCPCRACVVPGQPAYDNCSNDCDPNDPGGQLTVHIARIYTTDQFPNEVTEARRGTSCGHAAQMAAELVVTLLRCAPMPDPNTLCPPSCDDIEAVARTVHVDASTIIRAVQCCLGQVVKRYVPGRTTILTPQGGCTGVESRVTVALPPLCCPKESP